MNKWPRYTWLLATLTSAVCLTTFVLRLFVTEPQHMIGELGSDGGKNTFTYLYQSVYGSGYWFSGMNYPYGEHIIYTDGQPLLSVTLDHLHPVTIGQALTVMWILIDLSYVIAMLFTWLILTHFRMPPLPAILFAALITFFNPQLFRIQGHYSLAYVCFVPMIFYWFILYHQTQRLRYCIYLFIAGCLSAFLHLYYIGMMLVWVVSYCIGYFIFTKASFRVKLKHILAPLLSIAGVFGLISIVIKLTDPVTDRPVAPYNSFYDTCTRLRLIITSVHSPIWEFFKSKRLIYTLATGGEGYVYPGLVVCVTLAIAGLAIVINSLKKKKLDILVPDAEFSPIWLFIAALSLIIAMGIPFIWRPQWLDYLAIFRQFRSMGRFSWMFYHIATVYSVLLIYHCYKKLIARHTVIPAIALLTICIGIWGWEAWGYVSYCDERSHSARYNYGMFFSENEPPWPAFLKDHDFSQSDFQAILALPFYNVGTEKIWVGNSAWLNTLASKAAIQLHLPIVDVMMSRSSWSQAMKQVKIEAGPYAQKPMLGDLPNHQPFLLMQFDEDSLNPDQKYLLAASDYLGHKSQCYVYACYPDRIRANDRKYADSIAALLPAIHTYDTCMACGGPWYIKHYDADGRTHALKSAGQYVSADSSQVAEIKVQPAGDSQLYELSCWFLLDTKNYRSPDMMLFARDSAGVAFDTILVKTNNSVDNNGMWFRASWYFYLPGKTRLLSCILMNKPNPSYLSMNELVLRPASGTIISRAADGSVMVNNHVFKQ